MANKVIVTTVGMLKVLPHKKVEFSVSLTAERMLEISKEDFPKIVSQSVFGVDGFILESFEPLHIQDDKKICLEIKGSVKALVEKNLVPVIDEPKIQL